MSWEDLFKKLISGEGLCSEPKSFVTSNTNSVRKGFHNSQDSLRLPYDLPSQAFLLIGKYNCVFVINVTLILMNE